MVSLVLPSVLTLLSLVAQSSSLGEGRLKKFDFNAKKTSIELDCFLSLGSVGFQVSKSLLTNFCFFLFFFLLECQISSTVNDFVGKI